MSTRNKAILGTCATLALVALVSFLVFSKPSDELTNAYRVMHSRIHDGDSIADVEKLLQVKLEVAEPVPAKMLDWYSDKRNGYNDSDIVYKCKLMGRDLYFQLRDGKLVNHYNDMWDGDPHEVIVSGIAN